MTFVTKFHVRDRWKLLKKASAVGRAKDERRRRLSNILKTTLILPFILSKTIQWSIKIPIYILVGLGIILEYLVELVDDIHHLVEDCIFLTLYKVMKIEESEESE